MTSQVSKFSRSDQFNLQHLALKSASFLEVIISTQGMQVEMITYRKLADLRGPVS
jgi:hypothetical protein